MRGNSPEKSLDQVLGVLSVEKAKEFLLDSLNLPWAVTYPDHRDTFNVWLRRWQRVFTFRIEEEDGNRQTKVITGEQLEQFAPKLRTALRKAWYERDPRQRDWYFYRLRDEYHRMIVRAENPHLITSLLLTPLNNCFNWKNSLKFAAMMQFNERDSLKGWRGRISSKTYQEFAHLKRLCIGSRSTKTSWFIVRGRYVPRLTFSGRRRGRSIAHTNARTRRGNKQN